MKSKLITYSLGISILVVMALAVVNILTNNGLLWFIYPSLAILCIPSVISFIKWGDLKKFSLQGSMLLLAFFVLEYMIIEYNHPWFVYTILPIILWPIIIYHKNKLNNIAFSLIIIPIIAGYYIVLNIIFSPLFFWSVFVVFLIIWWPICLYYYKKHNIMGFSLISSIVLTGMFIVTNIITTPSCLWAVYPIFAVIWWPLTIYFFNYKLKNMNN